MGKYQARIAGDVIAGKDVRDRASRDVVTRVTFTDPQVCAVGPSEAQARERGIDVRAVRFPTGNVSGASTQGEGIRGTSQILVDEFSARDRRGHVHGSRDAGVAALRNRCYCRSGADRHTLARGAVVPHCQRSVVTPAGGVRLVGVSDVDGGRMARSWPPPACPNGGWSAHQPLNASAAAHRLEREAGLEPVTPTLAIREGVSGRFRIPSCPRATRAHPHFTNRDPHGTWVHDGLVLGWGSQPVLPSRSAKASHAPQSSQERPAIRRNSSALAVTKVAPRRSAWPPINTS